MPTPIALRAVFGQDEVSHGTARYRVGVGDPLLVPAAVAFYLLKNAGFRMVKRSDVGGANPASRAPYSQVFVRMCHPAATSCSYGGREYRIDENGDVLVPAGAAADLMAHGFVVVQREENFGECSLALGPPMPACAAPGNSMKSYSAAVVDAEQQGTA
jgi:hypothetical protein